MTGSPSTTGAATSRLRYAARILVLFSVTSCAGYVAALIRLPLAWMIGPMIAAAALGLAGHGLTLHPGWRGMGQMIVAAAVGLHFTPTALGETLSNLHFMLGAALATTAAGCGAAFIMIRVFNSHPVTAFYACVPGGPAEMAQLADRSGGAGPLVAASQSVRIALIVLLIPPLLFLLNGERPDVSGMIRPDAVLGPVGIVGVLAVAAGSAVVFRRLGIVSPLFLGPLAASALFAALGLYDFEFPRTVIHLGQLLLGTTLGLFFTREMLSRAPRFMAASLLMTLLLMAACALVGWAVAVVIDWPLYTMILATAPGSVTEMAVTAETLGLGVAGVTAFHIVRIFVMLPLTPVLFRFLSRHSAVGT